MLALVAALAGGCAGKSPAVPVGTADADKFLFDKGNTKTLADMDKYVQRGFFKE